MSDLFRTPIMSRYGEPTAGRNNLWRFPVDVENVEAHCANGILTVTVPKVETARPRRIEIRSGAGLGEITEQASA